MFSLRCGILRYDIPSFFPGTHVILTAKIGLTLNYIVKLTYFLPFMLAL